MEPLPIGVCSWSLKIPDLSETLSTIRQELGLEVVHLGFWDDSFRETDKIAGLLEANGLEVSATALGFEGEDYSSIARIAETGGYKPDGQWEARLAKTRAFADFTRDIGVKLLSTHIGFVPHEDNDPQYADIVDRPKPVCDLLGERSLTLVMETGQEAAQALRTFIEAVDRSNIGVNFDPANMILYGIGEPAPAIDLLRDKITHVHMKDAAWSPQPQAAWGDEVVLGTGAADIPDVVRRLRDGGYAGPLVIEREAGDDRIGDIKQGIRLLASLPG